VNDSSKTPYAQPEFLAMAQALTPISTSAELRQRVMNPLSPRPPHLIQREEGEFIALFSGVAIKRLRMDEQTETSLWRLDPGAAIPGHKHHADEECLIVSGSIEYAGRTLQAGDYLGALKDERQETITSIHGALLLIRGERLSPNMLS
jgi:anti-sigma factor ChrR (cupin superfamily)